MPPKKKTARTCEGCGFAFPSNAFGRHMVDCVQFWNTTSTQSLYFSSSATAAPQQQPHGATIHQQRRWINQGKAKAESAAIAQRQDDQKVSFNNQLELMRSANEDMEDTMSFADNNDDGEFSNNNNDDDDDDSLLPETDTNAEEDAVVGEDDTNEEDTMPTENGAPIPALGTMPPIFPLWTDFDHANSIRFNCTVSPSMAAGIQLMEVIGKHSVDLSLYDDIVGFISKLAEDDYNFKQKIPQRQSLHQQCEQVFNYRSLQPKMIVVPVTTLDTPTITMPVFDIQAVLAKMLQNPVLMNKANFPPNYDIFTGKATYKKQDIAAFDDYPYYDEFHTGKQWPIAVNHYCKDSSDAFPCGLVVFYDKSHADRHGTLAVSPVMFTLTLFNKTARADCKFWDVLAYVPNLDAGTNKTAKSSIGIERSPAKKLQDEHICLSNALRQLKDINENGGIPIRVMGKPVRVRVWIHVMVGDIFGNNGLLGSYSAYNAQCPYRDCSCPSQSFLDPNATCNLIRKADIDRMKNENDVAALKAASKYNIVNAFDIIPTGNPTDSIYHLTPPETMHAICSGVVMRMIDTLEDTLKSKAKAAAGFQNLHLLLHDAHSAQSEREASSRPSSRNHIFDTAKTQATEHMGNLFLIMCALHTSAGKSICKEAGVSDYQRRGKIATIKMILALERWLNGRTLRTDIDDTSKIQSLIRSKMIPNLAKYFPREEGEGWRIPKVHSLTKFPQYIQMFGSAVNFYGGHGESHLKTFMKQLAPFTQRRAKKFATQLGVNLYRQSLFSHGSFAIRMQTKSNYEQVINCPQQEFKGIHHIVFTQRSSSQYDTSVKWPKVKSGRPVDDILIYTISRYLSAKCPSHKTVRVTAYNQAKLPNNADTLEPYNAGPTISTYHVDTNVNRYDWCMICTHEIGSDEADERLDKWKYTCPAQIHGFVRFETERVLTPCKRLASNADNLGIIDQTMYVVVRTSENYLTWRDIEKQFIAPFKLGDLDMCTYILPASRIVTPLYVFEDHGQLTTPNPSFFAALPKRYSPFYLDYILNEPIPGFGGLSQKCEIGAA